MQTQTRLTDMEHRLITALILAPECREDAGRVHGHHFANTTCRKMWELFEQFGAQGKPWDLPTLYVAGDVEVKNWICKFDIDTWFQPPSLIKQYADHVRQGYMERLAAEVMTELSHKGKIDPAEFQSTLQTRLSSEDPEQSMQTMKTASLDAYKQIEAASEHGGLLGVETGFSQLNEFFRGFQKEKLYILAARPSMGKSALMLNIAMNAASNGRVIYIQALEEGCRSIAMRAFARTARVSNESLQKGNISDQNWQKVTDALGEIGSLPIFIDQQSTLTAQEICRRIRIAHQKCKLDLVCIDHLQEVIGDSTSRHLEISEACSYFKSIAKELQIPVLLVSQLSRVVEHGADKRPMLSHLKESGDIEQKADVVMMLFRQHYYDKKAPADEVELIIPKNRDGRTGSLRMYWEPKFMNFTEDPQRGAYDPYQ